jgi:type VI secretion system protein ImpC
MPKTTTAAAQGSTTTVLEESSLLDQVIGATKQTESDVAKDLLKTLVDEAMQGTVVWDRNIAKTINKAITMLDNKLSEQLASVMHSKEFLKLEGSWRGLKYLTDNSATSSSLKLKVMNLNKRELFKDLDRAVEFDQSEMFKKLYEELTARRVIIEQFAHQIA